MEEFEFSMEKYIPSQYLHREHVNVKVNICCGFHVRMGAPGVLSDRSSHPFIRQGPAIVSAPSAEDDESEDFSLEGRERKQMIAI
ncbi:unnamed protein product [Nesidiocoris tenuis]|uniref:Uncharacterized protein n=1 Tax=Nesidiocoris tenuis TaxID=355587 RepID=A0A6H5GDL6_9HEMI|nr:unnamed protein product [Nesidiocoris tenuis]